MCGRVVVHVGTPKTGSTVLQRFLAENRHTLNKQGWDYPDLNNTFEAEVPYTGRWMNGGRVYLCNDAEESLNKYIDKLDKITSKYNVIISDEAIFGNGHAFIDLLQQRYGIYRLIVFLRRQDHRIISENAQRIKAAIVDRNWVNEGDDVMELQDYLEKVLHQSPDKGENLFYADKIRKIEKIVGINNVSVNIYEEAAAFGLQRFFLEIIGLNYSGFTQVNDCNLTLSQTDTEVKRRLNIYLRTLQKPMYCIINDEYRKIILRE